MSSFPGVSTLILLYITAAEVFPIFFDAYKPIKRVETGDYEVKQ